MANLENKLLKLSNWLKKEGFVNDSLFLKNLVTASIEKEASSGDFWDFHIDSPPGGWPYANFSPEDVMSKGNRRVKIYKPALSALDQVASAKPAGKPVRLTNQNDPKKNGAYRDSKYNSAVGGASGSQHVHGKAFDIDVSDYSKEERLTLLRALVDVGFIGFGHGPGVIHADMGKKRFWTYSGYRKPKEEEYRSGSGAPAPEAPNECKMVAEDNLKQDSFDQNLIGVSLGDKADEVGSLQVLLKEHGYLSNSKVDCDFGEKTKNALIAFQRDSGLSQSGIVDQDTYETLSMMLSPMSEEENTLDVG